METLPMVTQAAYRDEYKIHLVFHDGVEATVDFSGWLEGPIFEPVRNLDFFQRFFVEAGTIAWPNGADIAPETLYERAKATAAA
ncbi:MAG: DUF2442 domain-containing protein [Actinobacteria bacterium]|nr:DUF2442 domain-containing protein [Actinomycetota bacterium]